jgi:hypothetical protein
MEHPRFAMIDPDDGMIVMLAHGISSLLATHGTRGPVNSPLLTKEAETRCRMALPPPLCSPAPRGLQDGSSDSSISGSREDSEPIYQTLYPAMNKLHFDRTDYSVVVKNRARSPIAWRWEIYRAGRSTRINQSSVNFHTMATANKAGKEALKEMLDKLFV